MSRRGPAAGHPEVRLRTRRLSLDEIVSLNGLSALSVERTIAHLLEQWADRSLVVDALRRLAKHLTPIAAAHTAQSRAAPMRTGPSSGAT